MTKFRVLLVAVITATFSLSMVHDPTYNLLNDIDYAKARSDAAQGPALTAPLDGSPYWSSYNQWLCFSSQNIEMSCLEAEYNGIKKVPVLHLTEGTHYFEFSMDPEPALDCNKVIDRWNALLKNELAFCAYAAPLQELDITAYDSNAETGSVWIINQLKTAKGYWKFESEENWLRDSDEDAIESAED